MHISQQSLSKAILNLEDELEVSLLERTNKGVFLTKQGKIAVEQATIILQKLEDFKTHLKASASDPAEQIQGDLTLLYTNFFDLKRASASIHQCKLNYPNIKIAINQMPLAHLLDNLANGDAELGLITLPSDPSVTQSLLRDKINRFDFTPLSEDRLFAVISAASPLAQNKSLSIRTLLKSPLIMLTYNNNDIIEDNWLYKVLSLYGQPNFAFKTDERHLYIDAIINNVGIGFSSKALLTDPQYRSDDTIVILPIRENINFFYHYVTCADTPLSPQGQIYLSYLTQSY